MFGVGVCADVGDAPSLGFVSAPIYHPPTPASVRTPFEGLEWVLEGTNDAAIPTATIDNDIFPDSVVSPVPLTIRPTSACRRGAASRTRRPRARRGHRGLRGRHPTFPAGVGAWCVAPGPNVTIVSASSGMLGLNNGGDSVALSAPDGSPVHGRTLRRT